MCWEIWVYAGGFLKEVIMEQCYGIIIRFQGNGTRGSVEHPGSADLSRMQRSKANEVIESVEQGDGDAKPSWLQSLFTVGKHNSVEAKSKALALRCSE